MGACASRIRLKDRVYIQATKTSRPETAGPQRHRSRLNQKHIVPGQRPWYLMRA
jgi:hypothetical protein